MHTALWNDGWFFAQRNPDYSEDWNLFRQSCQRGNVDDDDDAAADDDDDDDDDDDADEEEEDGGDDDNDVPHKILITRVYTES